MPSANGLLLWYGLTAALWVAGAAAQQAFRLAAAFAGMLLGGPVLMLRSMRSCFLQYCHHQPVVLLLLQACLSSKLLATDGWVPRRAQQKVGSRHTLFMLHSLFNAVNDTAKLFNMTTGDILLIVRTSTTQTCVHCCGAGVLLQPPQASRRWVRC
jgi:hypothetical protein